MRRGSGGHARGGAVFPTQLDEQLSLFRGEPEPGPAAPGMPTGVLVVGGPEHRIAGHLVGPASHLPAHVVARVERGEAVIGGPTAPISAESDEEGAATAQPDPTASPNSARPPGAAGPGRAVSGWSSPGLPGPGRPAGPRW